MAATIEIAAPPLRLTVRRRHRSIRANLRHQGARAARRVWQCRSRHRSSSARAVARRAIDGGGVDAYKQTNGEEQKLENLVENARNSVSINVKSTMAAARFSLVCLLQLFLLSVLTPLGNGRRDTNNKKIVTPSALTCAQASSAKAVATAEATTTATAAAAVAMLTATFEKRRRTKNLEQRRLPND